VELTSQKQIDYLRALRDHPANDIPGGYVDDDMYRLIKADYVAVCVVGNLFSYAITESGLVAIKRSEGDTA
jgi:hypothetical protein